MSSEHLNYDQNVLPGLLSRQGCLLRPKFLHDTYSGTLEYTAIFQPELNNFQNFSNSRNCDLLKPFTRKNLLCKYILSVLMHTTAWDRYWRGDEALI